MGKKKTCSLIKQGQMRERRYCAETEIEGKAIVAACLAATKVFNPPSYLFHSVSETYAVIGNKMQPINNGDYFPEGTSFFQLIFVYFRGHQKNFIMIKLDGKLVGKEIQWRIRNLGAPGYPELLTEEELSIFS